MRQLRAALAILACVAIMHCRVALASRSLQQDSSCELATSDKSAVALSADTSRTTIAQGATVKYLLDNQMCNDMLVCIGEAGLSGGSGCSIKGARTNAGSVCQIKATRTGSTYELSLNDATACTGAELVNCLSITAHGHRLLVKQDCAASISVTLSCQSCGGLDSVAVAQTTTPSCGSYGWCGKCDCPPEQKNCWAACKATKAKCIPKADDTVRCIPDDKNIGCLASDTTQCTLSNCGVLQCPPQLKVDPAKCPGVRARVQVDVKLFMDQQNDAGQWIALPVGNLLNYEVPGVQKQCSTDTTDGPKLDCSNSCQVTKTGFCKADRTGSCGVTRTGKCSATATGTCTGGEVITCPATGGTYFYPCDGSKCTKN